MFKIVLPVDLSINVIFYSGSFKLLCNQCHAHSGRDHQHEKESGRVLCFGDWLKSSCQPSSILDDGIVALLPYSSLFFHCFWAEKVRRYLTIQRDNCPLLCLICRLTTTNVVVVLALPLRCPAVRGLELAHRPPSTSGLRFEIWKCHEGRLASPLQLAFSTCKGLNMEKESYWVNSRDYFATKCIATWRFYVGHFLDITRCYCTK